MIREQITNLAGTSGVVGCCLMARDGAVLVNAFPDFVSHDQIRLAADAVVEGMLGLETLEEGAWEMDVAFAELLCVIRPVGTALLLVLCDPDANLPVLKLSMNVAAKRIAGAPPQEFGELHGAAMAAEPKHPEGSADEFLPPEPVRAVIAAIREQLSQTGGPAAVVDQAVRVAGLRLDAPTRAELRAALNEILEKGIAMSMGRGDATRWLNQLVKQHGLAKPGS